jgi:hypothetical protein
MTNCQVARPGIIAHLLVNGMGLALLVIPALL